jgi:chaperone required for assembly of F1-ATPase
MLRMGNNFRDLFGQEPDPTEAARRAAKPQLPRRFYRSASAAEADGEFRILLDGRAARTPAHRELTLPTRALADAVAVEWNAQEEHIDPRRMPLTRLVNSIIDGVKATLPSVAAEIAKYAASDLLFYRAETPALAARQAALWGPVLGWAREQFAAEFLTSTGVIFAEQPKAAVANVARAIPDDPWRVAALHSMTTLTGSALLALAVFWRRLTAEEAWVAAHVDEDWNMEFWGRDAVALERRAARFAEMRAAATLLAVVGDQESGCRNQKTGDGA